MMTRVKITILGGPEDGWSGSIMIPLEDEADEQVSWNGIPYRIHRKAGRMFLVHASAAPLI